MLVSDYASSVVNNSQQRQLGTKGAADADVLSDGAVRAEQCGKQQPLLAAIALSSTTALLHSAPSRHTTRLEAKSATTPPAASARQNRSSSRLWRDKDAP